MALLQHDIDLLAFNTFGFAVRARRFLPLRNEEDIGVFLDLAAKETQPPLILGGGSNVVLTRDPSMLVVRMELGGIRIEKSNEDHVWVEAGAGVAWHDLVAHCVDKGWGGIENLSLIPGTTGAAPIQNIGAYGVELGEVFDHLEAIEISTGIPTTFHGSDCRFGYRDSLFKHEARGRYLIRSVTLKLTRKDHRMNTTYGAIRKVLDEMGISSPTLATISEAVVRIRRSKLPDPKQIGNAGSFYKNPEVPVQEAEEIKRKHTSLPTYPGSLPGLVKIPAGWLIEQCGWKGKQVGHVGVHRDQALVLVHFGGGSGSEIVSLAEDIRRDVQARFGIKLEREVNIV